MRIITAWWNSANEYKREQKLKEAGGYEKTDRKDENDIDKYNSTMQFNVGK